MVTRKECLNIATQIVTQDRENQYGSPEDNFQLVANLWNSYLATEHKLSATDVSILLALLKVARIRTGKHKADNFIDLAGYAACACEVSSKENER